MAANDIDINVLPPLPSIGPDPNNPNGLPVVNYNEPYNEPVHEDVDVSEDDWLSIANGVESKKTSGVDNDVDFFTAKPATKEGYTIAGNDIDIASAKPIKVDSDDPWEAAMAYQNRSLGIWEEAKVKMDLGNLTKYRAHVARQLFGGKITLEQAAEMVGGRHQEILRKYNINENTVKFSFEKFKNDPLKTMLGESAQMLPFYADSLQKGAAYAAILGPATAWVRGKQGQAAGALAGTAVEPGGGTVAGAATGRTVGIVTGLIEGVNSGMLMGTFHTSMEIEGMNLYMDLREKGIDDYTAKVAGLAGGLMDGVLETASFGIMTAPVKGAAKKAAAKMLWKQLENNPIAKKTFVAMLTKVTEEYLKRVGVETSTEMLQDVVNTSMQYLAAQADSVDEAKPKPEDWKKIVTETGPQTAAAMLLMSLVSTPFDIANANVGSVKGGEGEIGTKAEIEQNLKDLSEGKQVNTGTFTLEGRVEYNIAPDTNAAEIEAELKESEAKLSELQNRKAAMAKAGEDTTDIDNEIKYEQEYQQLLGEELGKNRQAAQTNTNDITQRTIRKAELEAKAKEEFLTVEELKELNEIQVAEKIEREETDGKVLQGRRNQISTEIRDLDAKINQAEKDLEKAKSEGKQTNRILDRLTNLYNKRQELESERALIDSGDLTANDYRLPGAPKKVQFSAKQYLQQRIKSLKDTLKAVNNAIKTGVRMTRREIRDVQNSIISLVKDSDMSDKDKTKFFTTIRNVQTQEQLNKVLPDIIEKINTLEEKTNKKAALGLISKLLKQADYKKGGKNPVGKFTADIQRVLDLIKDAAKKTKAEAYAEIENIMNGAADRELTDAETERIRILNDFSGLKDKNSNDLMRIARALKMLIEDGKAEATLRELAQKQHREEILQQASESIDGNAPATGKRIVSTKDAIKQWLRTLGKSHDSWEGLMNILSQHDKTRKLAKILDVYPAKIARIKGQIEAVNKFREMAMEALGVKNERQFLKKLEADSKIVEVGEYVDQDGNGVKLQVSRAEARKLAMEMRDPTLRESLRQGNKYTFREDVFNPMDKSTEQLLDEFLTPEDKRFIDAQLDFYRWYYKRANSYYRDRYGVDMPYNENYSPVRREVDMDKDGDNWLKEATYRISIQPTSFKSRTATKAPLALRSDILVMEEHIATTEHFIAFDNLVRDMDTIFKNNDIRKKITEKFGPDILKLVDQHIADIKRDGIERIRAELELFDRFRASFTASMLGLKAQIALKQLTSIGVFALDIPIADFTAGIANFFSNPVKAVETLSKSYFLKDRADSLSIEIRDIVRSQQFSMFVKKRSLTHALYFWTQLGDRASIYVGGWAVYKHVLNKTGDPAKAMEAFERAVDKYQQSGHIDQLASWQRGNPLQKSFVMFMSDQMKQLRAEIHAIRDAVIHKDSASINKAVKTVAICHFILPTMVQFITNAFQWDNEDQLRAVLLGSLNATAIIGEILALGVNEAMRLAGGNVEDFGDLELNFLRPILKIKTALRKIDPEDITLDDFVEVMLTLSKETIGPLVGWPIKYVLNVIEKTPEYLSEDEFKKLGLLLMGWSPYIIEKKGQDDTEDDSEDDE